MTQIKSTTAPSGIESGKFTPEQRLEACKHFKIFGDGTTPLVRVGACSTLPNGRRIINFNCKSIRDYKENRPNASMGYPTRPNVDEGGKVTQFLVDRLGKRYDHIQKGDMVSLVLKDGYVQEILPASSLRAQEFVIGDDIDEETGEVLNEGDSSADEASDEATDEQSAIEQPKGKGKGGKPAEGPKAAAKDEDGNDLPF